MKRRTFIHSTALAGASRVVLRAASNAPSGFTVGAAVRDVTPAIGISLSGTISREGRSRGVNDALSVRATVIEAAGNRVAIVVVDACFLGEPVFSEAGRLVERRTGIAPSHLLVAATHSHAAPRALAIGRLSEIDDAWHQSLPAAIAEAVADADSRREPARLFTGALALPELAQCRRFHCDPGAMPANPFGEHGETVASVQSGPVTRLRPAGPTDPDFSVLYAARTDGTPLMLLGNYSVHYCGGYAGARVSADYFGAFCRHLEQKLRPGTGDRPFTALHSNGTSGDIGALGTPAALAGRTFAPFERGEAVGEWLAARVAAALEGLSPIATPRVAAFRREILLGVRKPAPERLAWAARILAGGSKSEDNRTRIYADEAQKLAAYPDTLALPVQVLRVGELAIAASPCETFAETGLAIKRARTTGPTFSIGLANGYGGYLPTAEQHDLGGYETWAARSSFLERAAESRLRLALIELVRA